MPRVDPDDSRRAGRDAEEQDEEIYGGYSAEVQEGSSGEMSTDAINSKRYVTHGLGRSYSLVCGCLYTLWYPHMIFTIQSYDFCCTNSFWI